MPCKSKEISKTDRDELILGQRPNSAAGLTSSYTQISSIRSSWLSGVLLMQWCVDNIDLTNSSLIKGKDHLCSYSLSNQRVRDSTSGSISAREEVDNRRRVDVNLEGLVDRIQRSRRSGIPSRGELYCIFDNRDKGVLVRCGGHVGDS